MAHGLSLNHPSGVSKCKSTLAYAYAPKPKDLSRRDKHRFGIENKSPHKRG